MNAHGLNAERGEERIAELRRQVEYERSMNRDYVESPVLLSDFAALLDAYEENRKLRAQLLERQEVQTLLRIIGAADAEESPVGQHLMKRLRDMVGLTGQEVYCAQCYLNGSGWFELAKGACPNPKCVLTAYQKTRTGLRP